jgi:hypothetical protein
MAQSFAIELVPSPVDTATDIEGVIRSFADTPNGGLFFPQNVASNAHRDLIIGLAARHRLPAVYGFRIFPLEGGIRHPGDDGAGVAVPTRPSSTCGATSCAASYAPAYQPDYRKN